MHAKSFTLRLTLLAAATSAALLGSATSALAQDGLLQRPIGDFLAAQVPSWPAPPGFSANYVGWIGRSGPKEPLTRIMTIDYAGLDATAVGLPQPAFSGSVVERPLGNGQTNVKVNLRTRNALAYVHNCAAPIPGNACPAGDIVFGFSALELAQGADPSQAAFGSSVFQIEYNVSRASGAPMENLIQMFFGGTDPVPPLGYDALPLFVGFSGGADGPLRAASGCAEATSGSAWTVQTGLIGAAIHNGFNGALADAFPAEWVELRPECN